MPEQESGSSPIRASSKAATKLQTIAALSKQMGKRFKPVEFVNGLIEKPIDELFEVTVREFDAFRAAQSKPPKKPAK